MNFQIAKVVLWPKNDVFSKRVLSFELSKVNIISGVSKTGKSAIIPIIDYCLGAGTCKIPVDIIRHYCEWFGVLAITEEGEKLFARISPEPGVQTTSKMYILESSGEVEIPEKIENTNSTTEDCRRILNRLTLLSNVNISTNENLHNSVSARDTIVFNFQPQHVVANPNILFYKTEIIEHKLKLSKIFPYLISAVNVETITLKEQLKLLQGSLRQKKREFEKIKNLSEKWNTEIRAKLLQAKELNLVEYIGDSLTMDQMLALLERVVNKKIDIRTFSTDNIKELANEISFLQSLHNQKSSELFELRQKAAKIQHFRKNFNNYEQDVHLQEDRLQLTNFLVSNYRENNRCPVCNSGLDEQTKEIGKLITSLERIQKTKRSLLHIPETFDKESQELENQIDSIVAEINRIEKTISNLHQKDVDIKKEYYSREYAYRFIGNLEKSLEFYKEMRFDSELSNEITQLDEQILEIRNLLQTDKHRDRTKEKLELISKKISYWLEFLDVEETYRGAPLSLDIKQLSIKVTTDIAEQYLWEIGSGSNHLAFHVATLLGLHEYLITQNCKQVLNYLVLDQPSQVYFPKSYNNASEKEMEFTDDDKQAVKKTIQTLVDFSRKYSMQIILLDHAAEDVWGEIPDCHLVEEWRQQLNDGTFLKLIPQEWIDYGQNQ
jgi:hypothetical protein